MDEASRRELMLGLLASGFVASQESANASPLNPQQTMITLVKDIAWVENKQSGPHTVDNCNLFGDPQKPGLYYTLVRWWPGFMSAPHHYATDRLCVVVSGVWWCNSGGDFDPRACVPVPAGSFVRRVARTPHYDGVPSGEPDPVVIAICGMGPIDLQLVDPAQPLVRKV